MLLAAHCAHEEAEGEPLLAKYLTDEDLKPFNAANRKGEHGHADLPLGRRRWFGRGPVGLRTSCRGPVRLFLKPVMQRKYKAYFR